MNFKLRNFIVLVCFCMFGIQTGLSFVSEYQDLMNKCAHDGGFCINTMPPQPPRRRNRGRGMRRGMRRRMGTRTRKGQRQKPSPKALGAKNNVLPGGRRPAANQPAYQPPAQQHRQQQQQHMGYPAPAQTTPGYTDPFSSFFGNMFGTQGQGQQAGGNTGMDPFLGMMMFSRKKRQAASGVQFEPGEAPQRVRGQSLYNFLGQHCRKTEYQLGCRSTGGVCCLPHLK